MSLIVIFAVLAVLMSALEIVMSFPRKDQRNPPLPGSETWWFHFPLLLWSSSLLSPIARACWSWLSAALSALQAHVNPSVLFVSWGWGLVFEPITWLVIFIFCAFLSSAWLLLRHGGAILLGKKLKMPSQRSQWARRYWHIAIIALGLTLIVFDGIHSAKHAPLFLVITG